MLHKSYKIRLAGDLVKIGNVQYIGRRKNQEDAFGFSGPPKPEKAIEKGILAVASDGMGGMESGAAASNAAVQKMISTHESWDGHSEASVWMRDAVTSANQAVINVAKSDGIIGQVGTTLCSVLIHEGCVHWASVGDSRIYLNRRENLSQLTQDHVFAQELHEKVKEGAMEADVARQHPDRGALTSYLGMPTLAHICQNDEPLILNSGDQLLLCSDGLYNAIDPVQIQASLEFPPQKACEALFEQVVGTADEHQDNMTAMVLEYERDNPSNKNSEGNGD